MKCTVPLTILLGTILTSSFAIPLGHAPAALQVQKANIAERAANSGIDQEDDLLSRRALTIGSEEPIDTGKMAKAAKKKQVSSWQKDKRKVKNAMISAKMDWIRS
jgi:hypothetical protein